LKSIDTPLYESRPTTKSIGNEYYIYADRIELKCRFPFFPKTLVIKKNDLISKEFVAKVKELLKSITNNELHGAKETPQSRKS